MQVPEFFFGILVFATKHGHDSEIRSIKHLGVTFVRVKANNVTSKHFASRRKPQEKSY